jgi:hypothetical protein
LFGSIVNDPRGFKVGAHARRACQPGRVDAGQIHHAHMFVEIVEQRMDGVARRAQRIVMEDEPAARIVLDQFARRKMVLKVDNHAGISCAVCALS